MDWTRKKKWYELETPGYRRYQNGLTLTQMKRDIKLNPKLRKHYRSLGLLAK